MNFKLDENFGIRTLQVFEQFGHNVHTTAYEGLQGAPDQKIYEICCQEDRCLVTLDLDFSDVLRFPPDKCNGIIVIRVSKNPSLGLLEQLVRQFLQALEQMTLVRQLWIVEIGRIRIHQADEDESSG